jgi:hypothetical protein
MNYRVVLLASSILGAGTFVLTGQQPTPSAAFTSAQAEAGRVAYENTCGKCHTPTLLGRKGDPGETSADQFPFCGLSEVHRASPLGPPSGGPRLHQPLGLENRGTADRAFSGDYSLIPAGGHE